MTQKKSTEITSAVEGLGVYVQERREILGLTQRELAERAQISHTFISRLETGQRKEASQPILRRLADALGVDAEDLYAAIAYSAPQQLPGFSAYLRAKYEMDKDAAEELAKFLDHFLIERNIKERQSPNLSEDSK